MLTVHHRRFRDCYELLIYTSIVPQTFAPVTFEIKGWISRYGSCQWWRWRRWLRPWRHAHILHILNVTSEPKKACLYKSYNTYLWIHIISHNDTYAKLRVLHTVDDNRHQHQRFFLAQVNVKKTMKKNSEWRILSRSQQPTNLRDVQRPIGNSIERGLQRLKTWTNRRTHSHIINSIIGFYISHYMSHYTTIYHLLPHSIGGMALLHLSSHQRTSTGLGSGVIFL
jgi:hypothetical protein